VGDGLLTFQRALIDGRRAEEERAGDSEFQGEMWFHGRKQDASIGQHQTKVRGI
jgi:hypothetical protein